MMMPANFSAISENEMTYVEGGAIALADILAPALEVSNWQTFNTNMVTMIGNKFVGQYVANTVGTLFGGSYVPGAMLKASVGTLKDAFGTGYEAMAGALTGGDANPDPAFGYGVSALGIGNGVLNAGLRIVGSAAAIYNLSTAKVENKLPSSWT